MRYDTAASLSTRHADLLAEAHAARLTGTTSLGFGRLFRRASTQIAGAVSEARSARVALASPVKSAAKS